MSSYYFHHWSKLLHNLSLIARKNNSIFFTIVQISKNNEDFLAKDAQTVARILIIAIFPLNQK